MNDFTLGNRIYEMRTQAGLSQSELAGQLEVTDEEAYKNASLAKL